MAYSRFVRGMSAAFLLSGVLVCSRSVAVGQEPSAIESGARVRIKLAQPGASWVLGRLAMLTADSLRLVTVDGDTVAISGVAVARLQVSRGQRSHPGTGALIGGAIAGGAGLALGILIASDDFFDTDAGDVARVTLAFGACGAALGILVGAQVRTERWATVPRPWLSVRSSNGLIGVELGFSWSP